MLPDLKIRVIYNLWGFAGGSTGKQSACYAGDLGSIPGLGRSPGEGKGYPLQCSGLGNSMDCIVHGAYEESERGSQRVRTRLSDFTHSQFISHFLPFFWSSPSVKNAFKCILYPSPLYCHSQTCKFYKALFILIIHNTDFSLLLYCI